jgi:HK97 family phage prohead protease
MDNIQAAVDAVLPATKFQIFSGILKANRSADGKMRLHGVASSTTKDLHGDTMMASAIEDMEQAANNNLTIFLNHSYEVPEDVAGSVESARMKTRGVDAGGNPNYDLDMDILVNDANPRAVKAFEAIERGTKLGLSIGALIPEGGARKEKGGAFLIDHVELLETSLVGIPANPRSWVEYAAKSLRGNELEKDATTIPLGSPTLTLDGNNWSVSGTLDQVSTSNTSNTVLFNGAPAPGDNNATPDLVDAYCPDCEEGDPCSKHRKDIEPDVADAAVTIIQIDTGDGSSQSEPAPADTSTSQGADSSNPGTGDGDYAATGDDAVDVAASVTPDLELSLGTVVEKYASAVSELLTAKQTIADLTIARDAALRERDAARSDSRKVVFETQRVLNQLADTPLMRKAVVVEANRTLAKSLEGIYSESVLKLLEKD